MKKFLSVLFTLVFASVLAFSLASCDKEAAAKAMKSVIVSEDNRAVTADFTVPAKAAGLKVSWTSSDTSTCSISSKAVSDKYTVKVTRPSDTSKEVTLTATIKANGATEKQTFKVIVNPVSCVEIAKAYEFKNNKKVFYTGFNLDSEVEYLGKTATISWALTDASQSDLVAIDNTTHRANITPCTAQTVVKLTATFTYGGESCTRPFQITVYYQQTHYEQVMYWYENINVNFTMSGYVVAIAENTPGYANIAMYVIDDDLNAGYYLYRVGCATDLKDTVKVGDHVTATGTTNTNYAGLVETNAGGTVVVDSDVPAKTEAEMKALTYDMGDDLIANAQTLYYRESTRVQVSNWKVKTVCTHSAFDDANRDKAVLVLTKDGVDLTCKITKYNVATAVGSENGAAIIAKAKTFAVGDYVTVSGILGYYNEAKTQYDQKSYVINLDSADDIVAGTEDTTVSPAVLVKTAVDKVSFKKGYYQNTTLSIPTTDGVEISCKLGTTYTVAALDGNTLTLTPSATMNSVILYVTFKAGTYSTTVRYVFDCVAKTNEQLVELAAKKYALESTTATTLELPSAGEYETAISWAVKEGETGITITDNVATITPVTEKKTVVLEATFALGDATKTVEVSLELIPAITYATVTDCANLCKAETKTTYFNGTYIVEGYIKTISYTYDASTASKQNCTFILTDGVSDLTVYKVGGDFAALITDKTTYKGAYVKVSGVLEAYYNSKGVLTTEIVSYNGITSTVLAYALPSTTDQVYAAGSALESNAYVMNGEEKATLITTGEIVEVSGWNDSKGNFSKLFIKDSQGNKIQIYGLSCGAFDASVVKELKVGDTITVAGPLMNYKGTVEFAKPVVLLGITVATAEAAA